MRLAFIPRPQIQGSLELTPATFLFYGVSANDLTVSPVALTHVLALDTLPFHHKDPFDRLLIAQSIEEDLTLVSADSQFSAYAVKLLQ